LSRRQPSSPTDAKERAVEKRDYRVEEAWKDTLAPLRSPGLLLAATDEKGEPNVMTIGWGLLGIVWGQPILTVFVRPSRFTYGLVDTVGDFTVNVAPPELEDAVQYCGSMSGRRVDKFRECHLTAAPSRHVCSPIIEECLLHYECRVVQKNDVVPEAFPPQIIATCYPRGDFHRAFFGEVVAVYGVPDFARRLRGTP
jgi:flavin reductase (DIM6/NTAB) family NADH-FMN oxidoreductase RutF